MFKNASHAPSFKVIVSYYKPSRLIFNFFELILKAYTQEVPNRTTVFQDWAHQSFICCLFYLLWTSVKILSQEAKGPIWALVQTLLTCVFHRKSFVIVTPKYLMFSTFSRTIPSRVYEAWIFFYSFPCYLHHIGFDRLKSHTTFPCLVTQLIYIFLEFQCVFCVLNFSVANTIISEESYFRINVCWDIINVQRKQQGTKDSVLWDTRQNRGPIQFCSVYNNSLLSVAQKRIYPFQCLPTYATAKQFALKELMRWCVNCFLKI